MDNPARRIVIAAALVAAALAAAPAGAAPAQGDMSLGSPKAKVKMVEYASLSCTHCADFNNNVLPAFKKKYVDTGRVHYTLRETITPPAPLAAAGFAVARCAGPANYFKVVDAIFLGFPEMIRTGDARANLLAGAKAGGLTEAQFVACVSDEAAVNAIVARAEKAAEEAGITGTPTFFFNGRKVAGHPMTAAELDAAVAAALETAK